MQYAPFPAMSLNLFRKTSTGKSTGPKAENAYGRQLTEQETSHGEHREFIGGMWDEIGSLQFEFLKGAGLSPKHRLLDVGCGCLRGGVLFVPYLEGGNYYGIDINASLIKAGKRELQKAGTLVKSPNLFVTDNFEIPWPDVRFDYALAVSVFTHLYSNHIGLCLQKVAARLAPGGKFFATFFQAPAPLHLADIAHERGGIVTHLDRDPFHYSIAEMEALASFAGLTVKLIGDWRHPRQQRMLCFS
jgi:cyclopropane fatty-acyl-phospholipid synthase-like methyltransferase